jgi:hypothetical protein
MATSGIAGEGYRYRNQKFTEHEKGIVALGIEAKLSDASIARLLGRPTSSVTNLRQKRGMDKKRGRGLWKSLAIDL